MLHFESDYPARTEVRMWAFLLGHSQEVGGAEHTSTPILAGMAIHSLLFLLKSEIKINLFT